MISRCSRRRGWPTNSSSRRGRSVVSSAASAGSAVGLSSSSLIALRRSSRAGQDSERVAEQLLDGAVFGELAEHVAHLVGRVAEPDERVAHLAARRRRAAGRPRPGRDRAPRGAPSARRAAAARCACRRPGTSISASRSSSARPRRSVFGVCTDRIASASFGPTPVARDQRLERVALVAGREAEEHHRVFAHVQMREQERVARRDRASGTTRNGTLTR